MFWLPWFPTAAVSGFYFSHPESRYFAVAKIDRDQVEEHFVERAIDKEEHPNARVYALRRLSEYAHTRRSAAQRLMTIVASETTDGIRIRAATALLKVGDHHLETLIEPPQDDYTKAIAALTLAAQGNEQQRRLGWDLIRILSSDAKDMRAADLCTDAIEQRPARQSSRQSGSRHVGTTGYVFTSALSTVTTVRSITDLHEARKLVDNLVTNHAIGLKTRQRALLIIALDDSVDDWARVGAAAGLLALDGDQRAAEQALNDVIRRAHPITASHAATVLRGMGASEDAVVQRFAEVGKEFFFHRVAVSVLSSIQGLDAFNAVAAIVKKHKSADLIPFLRDAMALLFPIASEEEWEYALGRAAKVTVTATRHAWPS